MWLIDKVAEEKIKQALERGELQDLPGEGQPIQLGDDSHVPAELRAGYRLLKNAGYIPPEVSLRKEIAEVESLIQLAQGTEQKIQLGKKLTYLTLKLNQCRKSPANLTLESDYAQRMLEKIG
ncbi:MAG: hypothetical protein AMJ53_02720 [Gammaproteobacteria bacterium SG8_11]|nr:MAG: hypothetical protein AMJ53_02720 [Gammaproteobacteria bacterium SG8_11]